MKQLPIDVNNMPLMISENYIYVDKTEIVHKMITTGRYYFLARPRRFGKSLLVSTLKEIFSGNKELFKDLWIGKSNYTWPEHPVIHLDFSQLNIQSAENLAINLNRQITKIANSYAIDTSQDIFPGSKIDTLVQELSKKNKAVIIIDEYDYPIINQLKNREIAEQNRETLRNVFSTIKSLDEHLRAIFITGVTKFSKTSVFSGLNNLRDITLDNEYATLLGYTHSELNHYFSEHINTIAQKKNVSSESIINQMCLWYDGYQFGEYNVEKVYNPFSVLYFLTRGEFKNYWFESGTPSFLINLMKKNKYPIENLEGTLFNSMETSSFDIDNLLLIPLLLQTGYLTIKEYNKETENYTLGFPNEEVKVSFLKNFLQSTTTLSPSGLTNILPTLNKALAENNLDLFLTTLQEFFFTIPYDLHIKLERYYQTIFYITLKLLGAAIDVEVKTNIGRIDAVLHTPHTIYIFEFKLDGTGQEALQQIRDKKYYEKYYEHRKTIILIGVSFDTQTRNITNDWAIEALQN